MLLHRCISVKDAFVVQLGTHATFVGVPRVKRVESKFIVSHKGEVRRSKEGESYQSSR